jgi:tetratricopeptide (TPR) repeat protein
MKMLPVLLLSAVVAVLAGGGAALAMRGSAAEAPAAAGDAARLAAAVDALRSQQADLRSALDALALQVGTGGGERAAITAADVDAAVSRWMDERQAQQLAAAAPEGGAEVVAEAAPDVGSLFDKLFDDDLGHDAREELWKQIRDAGLTDEIIKRMEAYAAANPQSPDAQVLLGEAYLHKIFEVGSGPESGLWATKADKAWDAALALDPQHWDARFSKAVSLSFWPPMFGKQAEAINHFETLIAQQESQASKPQFAQTYLWLGNLYMQQGKTEQAKETYAKGLAQFPGDEDLTKQLGLVQ